MEYQLQHQQETYLWLIKGANQSLENYSVNGGIFLYIPYEELEYIISESSNPSAGKFWLQIIFSQGIWGHNDRFLVYETYENNEKSFLQPYNLFRLMRLFKSGGISSDIVLSYKFSDGSFTKIGHPYNVKYRQIVPYEEYTLNEDDKKTFLNWIDIYKGIFDKPKNNANFNRMLELYEMSYYSPYMEHAFLTLFAILELLVGAQSEITFQVSRGIALLLSNNENELETSFDEIKKLYNVRSKFVHNGSKVSYEDVRKLRFFVQKTIIKLFDMGANSSDYKFENLRKKMKFGGYSAINTI